MEKTLSLLPQVKSAMTFIEAISVSDMDDPVLAGRKFYEGFIPMAGEQEEVFSVEDLSVPSNEGTIKIRVYRPSGSPMLPAIVYFHGGWFNAGNLETHDRPLRSLANLSGAAVISVDYRLAPEYPFPHGFNDCYEALEWIAGNPKLLNIDVTRIALAGDSAGGALATATTARALRSNGPRICCQALIYPVTDSSLKTSSWEEFADGPNLTLDGAKKAWDLYAPHPARNHPDASPMQAGDISALPPTLIIVAEYDPLRDEAVLYAQKLGAAGVDVRLSYYASMVHGFFQMGGFIDKGKQSIKEVSGFLQQHLSTK